MKAASWGETEVVVELVKGGADLNLQNEVCATYTNVLHVEKCTCMCNRKETQL